MYKLKNPDGVDINMPENISGTTQEPWKVVKAGPLFTRASGKMSIDSMSPVDPT
jgi:hypothetical protein